MERRGIDDGRGPVRESPRREPLQLGIEQHQDQKTKNEGRKRVTHNAENAGELVQQLIVVNRRLNAQPNSDHDDRNKTPQRQLEGGREVSADGIEDRHRCHLGPAQVAVKHAHDPMEVLHIDRLVQPVLLDDLLQSDGGLGRAGDIQHRSFARGQRHEHPEDQHAQPKQNDRQNQQAPHDISEHALLPSTRGVGQVSSLPDTYLGSTH